MPPEIVDQRYRLDARVDAGGQGEIVRATARLGRTVALKLGPPELAGDPVELQRFFDEGYISNHIRSKHVLPALDDGFTDAGRPYLVFPWVEGQNAEQRRVRAGGRLAPREVVAIALQALGGLRAAHDAGVVHRDMKPENVLISNDGDVYVADWGGASFRTHLGARTAAPALPPITPVYTSPEQARGEDATPRSDLFGLGAAMHALLSGRWPRPARHPFAMLVEAATRPLARLQDVAPEVPPALAAVVDRATAFEASARYPSASAMWSDLANVHLRMRSAA